MTSVAVAAEVTDEMPRVATDRDALRRRGARPIGAIEYAPRLFTMESVRARLRGRRRFAFIIVRFLFAFILSNPFYDKSNAAAIGSKTDSALWPTVCAACCAAWLTSSMFELTGKIFVCGIDCTTSTVAGSAITSG